MRSSTETRALHFEATKSSGTVSALLLRFASQPHKEPRAPQNLYPIAGLERALRRRLGDAAVVYRALRRAAAAGEGASAGG